MNKILRDEVDIGVAFSSAAKRQLEKVTAPSGDGVSSLDDALPAPFPTNIEVNLAENVTLTKEGAKRLIGNIKRTLRPIAQLVYRFVKPILRPIAFRLRRYFTDGLRHDIIHEINRVSAGTLQEVQAARESLRQEILSVSAGTLQEMQAVRESLRQEILSVSAGTLQEVQAARESLRQEILSVSALTVHSLLSSISPRFDRVEQYSYASARRVAINCGPGEVLVKTEVGYVLCSSTDHALLTCLIDTGELELGTRLLIQRFLRPGDVFVDVGANLGLHTLAAARSMQGLGKIIAFEPFEPTKFLLEKSVWINGFSEMTEIHQAAVSNHTGNQQLYLGPTSGHHSLFPLDPTGEVSLKPVEVHLVRLDEVVHADQKVDLIKIDAEGAELEVLDSGAAVILSNLDVALIVEFGPSHLKRRGQTAHQWFEAFAKLELLYRVINSDTGALEDWSLERLESTVSVNLFFARKDSKAWTRATT